MQINDLNYIQGLIDHFDSKYDIILEHPRWMIDIRTKNSMIKNKIWKAIVK